MERAPAPAAPLVVHDEVCEALDAGRGVVALESTILAHGLPHPDNLEIAAGIVDYRGRARAAGGLTALDPGPPPPALLTRWG